MFRHANPVSEAAARFRRVGLHALPWTPQRGVPTSSESPALERNGMTASSMVTRGNLRRQAVKSSAGVSDQFGFSSGVGQFRKRSLRSAAKAGRPRDYC